MYVCCDSFLCPRFLILCSVSNKSSHGVFVESLVTQALEGIKCDDTTGDVIRLCLSGNNLKGQLPVGLGTLTSLTQLVLSHNQLSGKTLRIYFLWLIVRASLFKCVCFDSGP